MHLAVYVQFVDDVASSPKLSTGSLRVARRAEGQLGVDRVRELPIMVLFVPNKQRIEMPWFRFLMQTVKMSELAVSEL